MVLIEEGDLAKGTQSVKSPACNRSHHLRSTFQRRRTILEISRMLKVLVALLILGVVSSEKARFDNYTVYRLKPESESHLTTLRYLQDNPDGVTFWSDPHSVGHNVDIMVPPHKKPEFVEAMKRMHIHSEVFIENVQERIDNENPPVLNKAFGWTSYYPLQDIYSWMDSLAADFPEVKTIVGGHSYEGRDIRGVKVSYGPDRPAVYIEAGIHAREWISPATVTWILNELLTSSEPRVRAVAEAFDWYVFPSTNPDGYVYSHTVDRMWRKTRKPSSALCVGVDPNRNWGYKWGTGGSSSNPCAETFAGPTAFSEPETHTLSQFLTGISDKLEVYLDFHSYSQFILIPYGTRDSADNLQDLLRIGDKAARALAGRYNTKFDVGTIYNLIGIASGGSIDWVKGELDTTISYAFELRDTGSYGFILPANQIIPSGEETLDAVVSILEDTLELLGKKE